MASRYRITFRMGDDISESIGFRIFREDDDGDILVVTSDFEFDYAEEGVEYPPSGFIDPDNALEIVRSLNRIGIHGDDHEVQNAIIKGLESQVIGLNQHIADLRGMMESQREFLQTLLDPPVQVGEDGNYSFLVPKISIEHTYGADGLRQAGEDGGT